MVSRIGPFIHGNDRVPAGDTSETVSHALFDNVRIYPRPQSHNGGILLVGARGGPIWSRKDGGWPPTITDEAGQTRTLKDLKVELLTENGAEVVTGLQSNNMGWGFTFCR